MIQEAEEQVHIVHEKLKTAQSRQKSQYDRKHKFMTYEVGEKAYLTVKGNPSFRYQRQIGSSLHRTFRILAKRGEVAYQLELPPHLSRVHDVFHVSQLRRCFADPIRGVDHETLDLQDNLSYREYPVRILDQAERTTRRHNIKFLKVQWSHHSVKQATWEREDRLRLEYPTFFPEDPKSRDEILLSGGELSHPS